MPSRIRNKIIFLACLFAFAGLGLVIYREWVVQKPFAVILFVVQIFFLPRILSAARLFAGGAEPPLPHGIHALHGPREVPAPQIMR